jgi:hypothetical protein
VIDEASDGSRKLLARSTDKAEVRGSLRYALYPTAAPPNSADSPPRESAEGFASGESTKPFSRVLSFGILVSFNHQRIEGLTGVFHPLFPARHPQLASTHSPRLTFDYLLQIFIEKLRDPRNRVQHASGAQILI